MTIQAFIEKAIEGGWSIPGWPDPELETYEGYLADFESPEILARWTLLDLEAWKAVGKVEGWMPDRNLKGPGNYGRVLNKTGDWYYNMHRMIDALAEGKTIEQYLETL